MHVGGLQSVRCILVVRAMILCTDWLLACLLHGDFGQHVCANNVRSGVCVHAPSFGMVWLQKY